MANIITSSFKAELGEALHDLSSDTLKLALYTSTASPGAGTTAYSATNEASGTGYTAAGVTLTLAAGYPQTADNGTGYEYHYDSAVWSSATFTARWGLIYNSSKSNRSVMVLDFGSNRSVTSGTFTVSFPIEPIIQIG